MDCNTAKLVARSTDPDYSAFNRCVGDDYRRMTFDDLPIGSSIPTGYLEAEFLGLKTPAQCVPVIEATVGGGPGEHSMVTCAAALGDVALTLRGENTVGFVFDRPEVDGGSRAQFLLRYSGRHASGATGPFWMDPSRSGGVARNLPEFAIETSFPEDQAQALLGFTSVFLDEQISLVELAVAGGCPEDGGVKPTPIRIAEIRICGKRPP